MIFISCNINRSKCEWFGNLDQFVSYYNKANKTNYSLQECLDVNNSTSKQPEVLIHDNTSENKDIVIEHKRIGFPPNYFEDHNRYHKFCEKVYDILTDHFNDSRYILTIDVNSLYYNKDIEDEICKIILHNQRSVRTTGIKSQVPVPFKFAKLNDYQCNQSDPTVGICIEAVSNITILSEDQEKEGLNYIKQELLRQIKSANQKFINYTALNKILVIEFCGEDYFEDDQIIEIMSSIDYLSINEVWIAKPEYISENDEIKSYYKII